MSDRLLWAVLGGAVHHIESGQFHHPTLWEEPIIVNNLFPKIHRTVVYDAIPIIVPILFVIGTVGALVYDRANKER